MNRLIAAALTLATMNVNLESRADDVVATIGGNEKIMAGDLIDDRMVFEYNQQAISLYQMRRGKLDELLMERLFKKEAGNTPVEEFIKKKIESKAKDPSAKEVKDFIAEQVRQKPSDPGQMAELEARVKAFLKQQSMEKEKSKQLEKLKSKYKVATMLAPELKSLPNGNKMLSPAGGALFGKKEAKVAVIEFSDFQCPYCSKAAETVKELKKYFQSKDVVFQFRHFPLSFHPRAEPASIGSVCADRQGKFWKYHDLVFENQQNLSDDDLKKYASKAGVNMKKYEECIKDPAVKELVQSDMREGQNSGVQSTPTFIVNGKPVSGALPFDVFKDIIEGELR